MALENKLGIYDSAELARVEEKISKAKAIKLLILRILKYDKKIKSILS